MAQCKVCDSRVELTEIVMPNDTNQLGNCMGGRVMHFIDIAAAISARRFTRTTCVTASVDQIDFLRPVPMGSLLVLHGSVNFVGRTSMEIGVRVEIESTASREREHCASAYLTFVSLGEDGKPMVVPDLIPESDEDRRRQKDGHRRRKLRLESR